MCVVCKASASSILPSPFRSLFIGVVLLPLLLPPALQPILVSIPDPRSLTDQDVHRRAHAFPAPQKPKRDRLPSSSPKRCATCIFSSGGARIATRFTSASPSLPFSTSTTISLACCSLAQANILCFESAQPALPPLSDDSERNTKRPSTGVRKTSHLAWTLESKSASRRRFQSFWFAVAHVLSRFGSCI